MNIGFRRALRPFGSIETLGDWGQETEKQPRSLGNLRARVQQGRRIGS